MNPVRESGSSLQNERKNGEENARKKLLNFPDRLDSAIKTNLDRIKKLQGKIEKIGSNVEKMGGVANLPSDEVDRNLTNTNIEDLKATLAEEQKELARLKTLKTEGPEAYSKAIKAWEVRNQRGITSDDIKVYTTSEARSMQERLDEQHAPAVYEALKALGVNLNEIKALKTALTCIRDEQYSDQAHDYFEQVGWKTPASAELYFSNLTSFLKQHTDDSKLPEGPLRTLYLGFKSAGIDREMIITAQQAMYTFMYGDGMEKIVSTVKSNPKAMQHISRFLEFFSKVDSADAHDQNK